MSDNETFIDPANNLTPSEDVKVYTAFEDMSLPDNLLRGIFSYGFERPSDIQTKGIVPIAERRDVIGQARSGTGKTGTFVIGSLATVDESIKKPQVLVLVHVRELAQQIAKVADAIGSYMKLQVLCAVGGNSLREDIHCLENGAQFIVGTPGRVYDLISRNALDRSEIRVLIMDEADQMLEDMFYKQIMAILEKGFPEKTRVALFSATMPEQVRSVAEKILNNPVRILVEPEEVRLDGIQQFYINLDREDHKFECICELYKNLNISQAVIFCNKRMKAEHIAEKMSSQGYPVTCIHGELEKAERTNRMRQFISGETRVMVATDIIARGIDVQQISLVINYELPPNRENYVHRIGRAGRFGRKGTTINLLIPEEAEMMKMIATHYGMMLTALPPDISNIL
jgi:translation initiation factor 4A